MAEPYLTMAEIEAKYPNEWVFIANPTYARGYTVRGGYVVFHAADRAEFLLRVGEWDDPAVKETASWYTGDGGSEFEELLPPGAAPGAA